MAADRRSSNGEAFRAERPVASPPEAPRARSRHDRDMHTRDDRGTVLIVEDEPDLRATLREIVEAEGYSVVALPDGAEALAYLRAASPVPRAVLLDMIMPHLNGLSVCREIKNDPRLAPIPVIIVSVAVSGAAFATCHAEAQFSKPLDFAKLLAELRRLTSSPAPDPPGDPPTGRPQGEPSPRTRSSRQSAPKP